MYAIKTGVPLFDDRDGICGTRTHLSEMTYLTYGLPKRLADAAHDGDFHGDMWAYVLHLPTGRYVHELFPYAPDTSYMTDGSISF